MQQEAASGGRATTRRSCSGSCKWWTDAGSGKASGAREKEAACGKEKQRKGSHGGTRQRGAGVKDGCSRQEAWRTELMFSVAAG